MIKKLLRYIRLFLFAFMFAVCIVMGIVPVIPKRKEQFEIEEQVAESEKEPGTKENVRFSKAGEKHG